MSSRPAEPLEDMIRRVIRDAATVGEPMTAGRLAFAVHAAGWTKRRRTRDALGETPADLVRIVREFSRNMDPADAPEALAEVIANHGYRHVRNPVHRTTRYHQTTRTQHPELGEALPREYAESWGPCR